MFRAGKGWEALEAELLREDRADFEKLPAEERKKIDDVDTFLKSKVEKQLALARTPWYRYFLDYDPAPALARVRCPLLALFGEKDLQVLPSPNRAALEAVLRKAGNRDITVRVLKKANHLYMPSETGRVEEYATAKKEFVPGFLDLLTDWILKQVSMGKADQPESGARSRS